jgi:succinylglutamate desuccinylase
MQTPEVLGLVRRWEDLQKAHGGPIGHCLQIVNGQGPKLVVTTSLHGNETGGIPGTLRFFEDVVNKTVPFSGTFTAILGNPRAVQKNVRLTEQDLNRMFGDAPPKSFEATRAQQIKSAIAGATLHIDLHQTNLTSQFPFYIFACRKRTVQWARWLAATPQLVTRMPGDAFAEGQACVDDFAESKNVPSVVLEMGQAGVTPLASQLSYGILKSAAEILRKFPSPSDSDVERESGKKPALNAYWISHYEPFTDNRMKLRDGITNFMSVKKGEVLATGPSGDIRAAIDGFILFPKYPERNEDETAQSPLPSDLYLILEKRPLPF